MNTKTRFIILAADLTTNYRITSGALVEANTEKGAKAKATRLGVFAGMGGVIYAFPAEGGTLGYKHFTTLDQPKSNEEAAERFGATIL